MDAGGATAAPVDGDGLVAALPRDLALLALAYALPNRLAAFRQACDGGDARVVRFVATCLALTPEEVSAERFLAIEACERGHLGIVRWLVGYVGLTAAEGATTDTRAGYNVVLLRAACRGGAPRDRALARRALRPDGRRRPRAR